VSGKEKPTSQLSLDSHFDGRGGPSEPQSYSVGDLVGLVSKDLERRYGSVWVEGEVSNLSRPASGHHYFSLKDDRAQLRLVMFRTQVQRLKFRLEDGQVLRCRGRLTIYPARGTFQMIADQAEPAGLGALQLAFEQLKKKLDAEGLFSDALKKKLPLLPRTIVLVTSSTGAAVQDMLRVLHDRCPVRVVISPTAVQGAKATAEIVQALRRAESLNPDLIIVGRGGGSLEDLWAFNTEEVARAIFSLRVPVISAVGHEVDTTISDLVADVRAATPTRAAELAVPELSQLQEQLTRANARMRQALQASQQRSALSLQRMISRLRSPKGAIDQWRMKVDEQRVALERLQRRRLVILQKALGQTHQRLRDQQPQTRLLRDRARLTEQQVKLHRLMGQELAVQRGSLERFQAHLQPKTMRDRLLRENERYDARLKGLHLAGKGLIEQGRRSLAERVAALQARSPLAILSRGYSVALDEQGQAQTDASELSEGDSLEIVMHRGRVGCRVEKIHVGEPLENE
jgi:exodeoxyribonuclease VII large subunit